MPTDPNNDYTEIPVERGAGPYDQHVNTAMDTLAQDRVVSGPIADRPNPGVWSPQRWYATDEHQEYYNTGSSWREVTPRYRLLSSFPTVQDAVNHGAAIFIDGRYETDEGTITLPQSTCLFGMGSNASLIVFTQGGTEPLFTYPSDVSVRMQWSNFGVELDGTPRTRQAVVPDGDLAGGFLGSQTIWQNLLFENVGGTYPIQIENAYGVTFENIFVRTQYSSVDGHYHFKNCNACTFRSIKSLYNVTEDGETPCMYIERNTATSYISPHIEHLITDAAMQIQGGVVSVIAPHIEGNEPHPADVNCGIQIGDGGITTGNTAGATGLANVQIIGGVIHGSSSTVHEGIRILNNDDFVSIGGHFGGTPSINAGGSNHDAAADLTVNPGTISVFANNSDDIVWNHDTANPQIVNFTPIKQFSDANLADRIEKYQIQWLDNESTPTYAMAYKDDEGVVHVWDANRTL